MKFTTNTKWVIISGAPCSGKTSVIEALRRRGYRIADEIARQMIEDRLKKGESLENVRATKAQFQRDILEEKRKRDALLNPGDLIFFDRGTPDSIAYFTLYGLYPAPAAEAAREYRYAAVFLLDRLPFAHDGVRTEDDAIAARLDTMIENDYAALGYDPVRVPVTDIESRADLILAHLAQLGALEK